MSKERLELLKRNREWTEATGGKFYTVDSDDYKWLIKQAERTHELEQQNKRYREAIKECVERMNAGGAGTRNFVYETLKKALEVERMNEFCPTCNGSGGIDVFDWSAGEVVTIPCPDCGESDD